MRVAVNAVVTKGARKVRAIFWFVSVVGEVPFTDGGGVGVEEKKEEVGANVSWDFRFEVRPVEEEAVVGCCGEWKLKVAEFSDPFISDARVIVVGDELIVNVFPCEGEGKGDGQLCVPVQNAERNSRPATRICCEIKRESASAAA